MARTAGRRRDQQAMKTCRHNNDAQLEARRHVDGFAIGYRLEERNCEMQGRGRGAVLE